MISQKSSSSTLSKIPEKWREKFLIKRFDEEDVEITLEERNMILQALKAGGRFIQIGKYTLMINAIKSIDPKWGKDNIPPRPRLNQKFDLKIDDGVGISRLRESNETEVKLWDSLFGKKLLEGGNIR